MQTAFLVVILPRTCLKWQVLNNMTTNWRSVLSQRQTSLSHENHMRSKWGTTRAPLMSVIAVFRSRLTQQLHVFHPYPSGSSGAAGVWKQRLSNDHEPQRSNWFKNDSTHTPLCLSTYQHRPILKHPKSDRNRPDSCASPGHTSTRASSGRKAKPKVFRVILGSTSQTTGRPPGAKWQNETKPICSSLGKTPRKPAMWIVFFRKTLQNTQKKHKKHFKWISRWWILSCFWPLFYRWVNGKFSFPADGDGRKWNAEAQIIQKKPI